MLQIVVIVDDLPIESENHGHAPFRHVWGIAVHVREAQAARPNHVQGQGINARIGHKDDFHFFGSLKLFSGHLTGHNGFGFRHLKGRSAFLGHEINVGEFVTEFLDVFRPHAIQFVQEHHFHTDVLPKFWHHSIGNGKKKSLPFELDF
jgi:hypothetical protein